MAQPPAQSTATVSSQYAIWVRRYAPFKEFSGYEGDNRSGASTSLQATSRCWGFAWFNQTGVWGWQGGSSGSEYMGMGGWLQQAIGRKYADVHMTVNGISTSGGQVRFTIHNAGANPLAPPGAPPIDSFVDLTTWFQPGKIVFIGRVRGDAFPNGEVFVIDPKGTKVLLFDFHTKYGPNAGPMLHLWGKHENQVLGQFNVAVPVDSSGNFVAPVSTAPITVGS